MKGFRKKVLLGLVLLMILAGDVTLAVFTEKKREQVTHLQTEQVQVQGAVDRLQNSPQKFTEEHYDQIQQAVYENNEAYRHYTHIEKYLDLSFLKEKKPENVVDFYFLWVTYVKFLANYADRCGVEYPKDCGFGFDTYGQKEVIPDQNLLEPLYKQAKILTKLLVLLFDGNEYGMQLRTVQREAARGTKISSVSGKAKNEPVLESVAGTLKVDTWNERRIQEKNSFLCLFEFSCYTQTLRHFLNQLQTYNLPVVIRDFEIQNEPREEKDALVTTERIAVKLVLEWVFIKNEEKQSSGERKQKLVENVDSKNTLTEKQTLTKDVIRKGENLHVYWEEPKPSIKGNFWTFDLFTAPTITRKDGILAAHFPWMLIEEGKVDLELIDMQHPLYPIQFSGYYDSPNEGQSRTFLLKDIENKTLLQGTLGTILQPWGIELVAFEERGPNAEVVGYPRLGVQKKDSKDTIWLTSTSAYDEQQFVVTLRSQSEKNEFRLTQIGESFRHRSQEWVLLDVNFDKKQITIQQKNDKTSEITPLFLEPNTKK